MFPRLEEAKKATFFVAPSSDFGKLLARFYDGPFVQRLGLQVFILATRVRFP